LDLIGRIWQYGKRNGIRATANRAGVCVRRAFRGNWFVLFYHDLGTDHLATPDLPETGHIERKNAQNELSSADLAQLLNAWVPDIRRRQLQERFTIGASLWLLKLENRIAAYGWSVLGRTIEPHFFPLAANEAHLFDFFVFPEFRGRRLNPALVDHILFHLGREISGRVFIEAAQWNQPQLASLARMPFRKLGCACKFQLLGRTIVMWRRADP
jgi:GNAT superfamily N-acetyltransferase